MPIPAVPTPEVLNEIESWDVMYSLVNSLSVNTFKSKSESDVLDIPKVNLEFFTTLIWGLINPIRWSDPPVLAVNETTLTGSEITSINVSPNWKYLSLTL